MPICGGNSVGSGGNGNCGDTAKPLRSASSGGSRRKLLPRLPAVPLEACQKSASHAQFPGIGAVCDQ